MEAFQLFVDESGRLRAEWPDEGVVAGVLWRAANAESARTAVRARIEQIFPLVPYPPHATDLNRPISRVVGYRRSPAPRNAAEHEVASLCEGAWDFLRTHRAEDAPRAFVTALEQGVSPSFETLDLADVWLRARDRRIYGSLSTLAARQRQAVRALFKDLPQLVKGEAFLVAAGLPPCSADTTQGMRVEEDPYLHLLGALFERVVALLRTHAEREAVVATHVARRDVLRWPWARPRALDVPTVAARAAESLGFPLLAPERPELGALLRFRVDAVVDANRDADVHPGLVLADFVANRLLRVTGHARSWTDYRRAGEARLASPLERAMREWPELGPLPTVAAGDPERSALREAFATGKPARLSPSGTWVTEQAARWMVAAIASRRLPTRGGQA